MAILSWYRTR